MRTFAVVLAGVVLLSCRPAANSTPELRIAVGGRGALDFVPIYIAESLGFFRDARVKVAIQDLPGTAKAVQSLLGGSSELVAGGYDAAIEMVTQGKRLQSIALIERWPPLVIVASNSPKPIRTIRDLKGAKVGVSSPGSSNHQFLNYLLTKNGLKPSDISPVGVGVNVSMAAAIERGHVQAAVAGPLGVALLEKNKTVTTIVDCRTEERAREALGTNNLPFAALLGRSEWVRDNPETLRKVGQAMRRTLRWIHEHSAQQVMHAMPEQYKGEDPALYLQALRDILPVFSSDGIMPEDGPSHVRNFLAASNPHLLKVDLKLGETYTDAFIRPEQ